MKRFLAIEELGTSFQPEKRVPLVRLKGHWLKAAGFAAGNRVTVTCLSPGVIELRAEDMHQMPELCAATLVNRATAESAPQAGWPCSLHNEPSPGLSPRDKGSVLAKPQRPPGTVAGATLPECPGG
jgi:hypothetical protein